MPVGDSINTRKIAAGGLRTLLSSGLHKKILIIVLPLLVAAILGVLMAKQALLGLGLVGLVVGTAILLICISNAEAGLFITLGYSFMISHFNRLFFNDSLTVGVFADILVGATFIGFLIRKEPIGHQIRNFAGMRVGALLFIIYLYTLLEIFNPAGPTIRGAVPVIRKILAILMLVLTAFTIFQSKAAIRRYVIVLFFFCVLTATYACIQEWFGFFDFEMNWLRADPRRFRMTFVNGGARRMSFFLDAVSLSIVMATASVFFTGVAVMQKKVGYKIGILCGVLLMLLAMGYSLTRTSNVMFVAGIVMFMLITFDKLWTRIFSFVGLAVFLVLLYAPFYGNNQIAQFRQTFKGGTKDPSYLVREMNRKSIQPYIYRHPFGGGLSTTGEEGLMYHPGHRLAGFPPDSGSLKKALELGWIGFGLMMFLYFSVLRTGINGYFTLKKPSEKILVAACTAALFAFYVGDFAQVAIGQITDVVVYYPLIAIILQLTKKVNQIEKNEQTTV